MQLSPEHVNLSVALGENEILIVERVNLHWEQNLHGIGCQKYVFIVVQSGKGHVCIGVYCNHFAF